MLPIEPLIPDIRASLAARPNLVLVAPPGAGKTTRVPLALLDEPWAAGRRVLLLEPRRLAARASAARMAATLGETVGGTVGLRVRMDTRIGRDTRLEVITEGVFTRMILDDPGLDGIAAVLFDEVHERSLEGDLGLALALDAQSGLREDLRLLAMSATLDGAFFASLMGGAPVLESEGRAFPVETRHRGRPRDLRVEDAATDAILATLRSENGSVLAFLPGAGEIRRVEARLAERLGDSEIIVAPLYGALDMGAQDAAIRPAPQGRRKVVLATSIAETSLTIEGVRIVVDAGLSRRPRYDPASGLTRLETVRVSRASADQRRGRAGRTEPGLCIRLWDKPQTRALAATDRPEMLESDLAPLVLTLAEWGVADPALLAWLDPPPAASLAEARKLLLDLDALDGDGRITPHGRRLSRLPLPPRLGHMILAAESDAALAAEIAVILTERGLGGRETDLRARIDALRRDRSPRAREARALAERWAALVPAGKKGAPSSSPGRILALAYPDRVGKARDGQPGAFLLANGRGARLDAADPLAREAYLAVAELTGSGADGRIVLAAALAEEDIDALFSAHIVEHTTVAYDEAARTVRARRERRLGALVLASHPVPCPPDLAEWALLAAIREGGLATLPWTKSQAQWRDRLRFLRAAGGEDWPDLGDDTLLATLEDWLGPFLAGKTSLSQIAPDDLYAALKTLVPFPLQRRLDEEAPTHFDAPSGSRLPIRYEEDGPVLAVRVQELFGLGRHPSIAGGRVPLTLELLSPAHRPVQVTRDLPGFWAGSYAAVRADLRGRYPKHPWPEDPLSAPATHRAKPRGT